ncbi:hypothetical protein WJX74_008705 [Apatococcus lobatus]|uniref:alpha,alpha-trehalose-phosphate synthase (UDP-forming) n=1 Tax=Apatococcus lobatus TaxID=904363 RepID=A0AAW1R4H2_9CHLO
MPESRPSSVGTGSPDDSPRSASKGSGGIPGGVPSNRVDRLLLQRIRKSQSGTTLYREASEDAGDVIGPGGSHHGSANVEVGTGPNEDQRLLVVANRLPVSAQKTKHGSWDLQMTAGGLVSALRGVQQQSFEALWVGWPGVNVEIGKDQQTLTDALRQQHYVPVYLNPSLVDLHYNGFCNSVLWQLFHYVPLNTESKLSETKTLQKQWAAYQAANHAFAEAVLKVHRPGDVVWVQDYHLMLLPGILKTRVPDMKVGWFLHTPFPSSEIYRALPVREEVLKAVLKSDLIGFHTYDYARHFVSACTRILGLEGTPEGVEDNGLLTRVAAFPIGIDPDRFKEALGKADVKAHIAQLRQRYAGRKVMLGVDRLDMIKGIPQKLLAFEKFLEEHPEWADKLQLVQIAVPSRVDVPEYQRLRSMVHQVVGRINGAYGTLTHLPIHHLDKQLPFHELCALYAVTDVALVTSLRDGMNLVSYEYVACQRDNAGVLVLSEFAGAAQSLGAGAILVNPWNVTDMANAIEHALTMSNEERRERHRQNYHHVTHHTVQTWADVFITELNDTHVEAELRTKHIPPPLSVEQVVRDYDSSQRHLLVLGYNATLTTAVEAPRQPIRHFDQLKAMTHIKREVFSSLRSLTADQRTTVVIFSGSSKAKLEALFGDMDVWLAAENGVFMRPPSRNGQPAEAWQTLVELPPRVWMESVQLVYDYFCERTPRSFVEARDTSVVWNYRYADTEFGRLQARDLLQHLWTGPISNAPVDIVQGTKSVEVRPVGISKGLAMQRIIAAMADREGLAGVEFDFVMVAGHFLARDENIFTFFEGQGVRTYEASKNAAPLSITKQVQATGAVMLPEFLAERSVVAEGAAPASTAPVARAASLPSPHSPPDSVFSPSARLGDAAVLSVPSPSLDCATVSRPTPHASTESPSRHRSPTRFGPIPHQSDLPPAHPGFQRPRTAPNTGPTPAREPGLSSAPETTPQGWFARHQQQERLWQGSSQQQAQQHSRAQQLQAQQHRAPHFLHRPDAAQTQRQSIPELSTPFASYPPRSNRAEDRPPPQQQPHDWHTNNSWHGIHRLRMMEQTPGIHAVGASSLVSIQEAMSLPLHLPPQHLYTCTIGRKRSQARWLLNGSNDVGSLLSRLAHQQAYSLAGMDSDDTEASAGSM